MQLRWTSEYHGPSPYASSPVVVAELGPFGDQMPADQAMLACSRLEEVLPLGLLDAMGAHAAWRDDGARLLVSVAVHWALAALNEVRGCLHDAGVSRVGDRLRLWLGFHHAPLSREALQLALRLVWGAAWHPVDPRSVLAALEQIGQACSKHHPDYQARILMVGARRTGVPFLPFLPDSKYWQFGWGASSRVFFESSSNADGLVANKLQRDKEMAKKMMVALGMPTPPHLRVDQECELEPAVRQLGYPCALKPVDGGGGKGVTANIRDMGSLRAGFAYARRYSGKPLLLEKHVPGDDHRLMVIDGRLIAAIRREPSSVLGDGRRTVAELLADLNRDRSRNMVRSRYLRPIPLDAVLTRHLDAQGVSLSDVLLEGQRVTLRSNANLSTGGVCTDVTASLHPQVREMAEQLALTLGLATAGLDYLTTDITRAPSEVGGGFIELNSTPALDVCVAAGWSEESIARRVLGHALDRIPVELHLVAEQELDQRLAELRLETLQEDEGWACGAEVQIGSAILHADSRRPWGGVQAALRHRRLRLLRVICTAADLVQKGLPVDRFSRIDRNGVALPEEWLRVLERCSGGLAPRLTSG